MSDNNNLSLWNQVKQPPSWALKKITGGRLSNKTDISPQWRLQALTELFGPCGTGWYYEIVRLWNDEMASGEVIAHAEIKLYVINGNSAALDPGKPGYWSAPIPGIGGNKLVEKESGGLHVSDEGYKMAVTDAISVACKQLGIAADIYAGSWDGSKYTKDTDSALAGNTPQKASASTPTTSTASAPEDEKSARELGDSAGNGASTSEPPWATQAQVDALMKLLNRLKKEDGSPKYTGQDISALCIKQSSQYYRDAEAEGYPLPARWVDAQITKLKSQVKE